MKALVIFTSFLFLNLSARADVGMKCEVGETKGGQTSQQILNISNTGDAHGSLSYIDFKFHKDVLSGFVAFYRGIAIINIVHNPTGFIFTSHGDLNNGGVAHHQMFLPTGQGQESQALVIDCVLADDL